MSSPRLCALPARVPASAACRAYRCLCIWPTSRICVHAQRRGVRACGPRRKGEIPHNVDSHATISAQPRFAELASAPYRLRLRRKRDLYVTRAVLSLPARPTPVFGRVLDQTVARQAHHSDAHWETGAGDQRPRLLPGMKCVSMSKLCLCTCECAHTRRRRRQTAD